MWVKLRNIRSDLYERNSRCTSNTPFLFLILLKGEKKLGKVITPDPWKSGARNTTGKYYRIIFVLFWRINLAFQWYSSTSHMMNVLEGGGRKLGENKLLTSKKNRYEFNIFSQCQTVTVSDHHRSTIGTTLIFFFKIQAVCSVWKVSDM